MEKLQAKGELDEDQLKAFEMDVTGKVCASNDVKIHFPKQ
jgi:hypothetical protein